MMPQVGLAELSLTSKKWFLKLLIIRLAQATLHNSHSPFCEDTKHILPPS